MKKICNGILIILLIIAIILSIQIINRKRQNSQNEKNIANIINQIKDKSDKENAEEVNQELPYIEYEGYQVIGIVKIEKINIEYPILNESSEASMKKSIIKFWGDKLNQIGNVTLAGHNNMDGTMFGKINKLEIEDEIKIIDLYNNEVTYKIFDKYITDPNDIDVVKNTEEESKEITLITCINGNKNRLIIKAKEI